MARGGGTRRGKAGKPKATSIPKVDDRAGLSTDEDTDGDDDAPKLGPRLTEKVKKPKKRKVRSETRNSTSMS